MNQDKKTSTDIRHCHGDIDNRDIYREGDDGKEFLFNNLIKLGDMMGDGLHHEPGGAWIEKEYRKTLKQLGLIKPKSTESIDKFMIERCNQTKCTCGGTLKQSRKGSFIAKCMICGEKYRLGKRKK